nr:hypothetical protein [Tanacetum cinerariifolium]
MQPPMTSLEDINDPTEAMNAALILFAKAFQLSAPTNNNQRTSSNPRNWINAWQNGGIQGAQNAGVQNDGNQNGLVIVPGIANQSGTGNVVAAGAEGTRIRNQARCYNCRGLGHIARNCTARPRRRDASYLQTQLLIAQKEEAGIQLQAEEFDFMAAAGDLDEVEEVNANCILMANLQQASTSGTQHERAPVYDTDGSAEVHLNDNCYDNKIFNMFTQEEQYTDLLEPIPEPQLVLQNDNHVTSVAPSMVHSGGTVETSSAPIEEIHAHQEIVYRNLVDQVAQEIKPANYAKINHLSGVFVSQTTKSKEELFLSNVSSMVIVSKTISIPNEDLSDDTTPSVARKFLNEVKSSLVTLQRVVKQKMTLEVHNWSSSAHKEEADESLDKQKSLELEIKRLLKASVSHDIMSIVQNSFVNVPSDLRTELDRTKEKLELCIIKREKEYAVLWNNWYTKCEECKYDKISYDKAYNDMQQKVERLQAPLRYLKGKSSNTPSSSNTLDPLNQKLESKIVELEFQVVNYKCEISHLKNTYKNLFDSIKSNRAHAKLHDLIFKNAKLRARLFENTSESVKTPQGRVVYFVEDLGHNLFSVGQFCDADLEVAFRKNTCFIRDLDGVDLLKGNRSTNLYTINLYDMASASPIYLAKNDLVFGLPKFKYAKEHVCPSCEQGKSKRASHPPKSVLNSKQRLHLRHMDLCGPMRVASINEVIKNFLKKIYVRLQAPVIIVHTDNETEFKNQVLKEYFDSVGITHETSAAQTPQQNGVVERRNRTLVEAARTMLIFSHAPLFLWGEAIATACYTQNHSIIHRRFNKTPYELIQGRKPDISYLHVFGALCYPKNDREDIGKLGAKAMAFEQNSSRPRLQSMTSGQISSELELTYASSTITPQRPSKRDMDILFEPLHNEYLGGRPAEAPLAILAAPVKQNLQAPTASMSVQDSASVPTNSSNTPVSSQNVDATSQQHAQQQKNLTPSPTASAADNVPNAEFEGDLFVNPFGTPSTESAVSSTQYVDPSNMHMFYQPCPHDYQWTKDHPLEQVIGEPSRPVLIRNQLKTDGDMCIYALTVSIMEPKTIKEALTDPAWIESMQEELHQFIRLDVWELIPSADGIKPLTLKWLFKNKHDEENMVIHNKTRLVMRGYR